MFIGFLVCLLIKKDFTLTDSLIIREDVLSCSNLNILFDENISFSCGEQFSYSIQYGQPLNYKINVEESVNIINNSNKNFNDINLNEITKIVDTTNNTKILFTEFLNMGIIDTFIKLFSSEYHNIWLTMEWKNILQKNCLIVNGIDHHFQKHLNKSENILIHFQKIQDGKKYALIVELTFII